MRGNWGLSVLWLFLGASAAVADTCVSNYRHTLNGHSFLPIYAIPTAIADSNSLIALGLGYRSFPVENYPRLYDFKIAGFTPRITGNIHLFEPFSLVLGLSGTVVSGLNTESALQYGASTAYNIKVGGIFELIRSQSSVLSLALDLDFPHSYAVSPLDVAGNLIQEVVGSVSPDFSSSTTKVVWRPNARFAHAFNSVFGLQSLFGFRFESTDSDAGDVSGQSKLQLGIAFEADLKDVLIPIGFTLSYLRGQKLNSAAINTDTYSLGIYETISPAFNFGVEAGFTRYNDASTTLVALNMRAYYD